ncbi:MAG: rod shape-determining protein MreD [Spirochaetales bacterium]|nr:rod shape-determining protein MreD [Spirochaetales bacterium]
MAKSILISTIILLCTTVIESSLLSNISFLYVIPDLVLMCSIYFSLLNGRTIGQINGFISGVFLDFVTGLPFGFNCLYRTIIGYLFGLFSKNLIISGLLIPVVSVGIGTIAKTIFIQLINVFFPNVSIYVTGLISYNFLFEFIENIILAPVIFKFLSFFKKYLVIQTTQDKVNNVK